MSAGRSRRDDDLPRDSGCPRPDDADGTATAKDAERLAQLEVEKALFDELAKEDFEGDGWLRLADVLAGYGLTVVFAWLVTGEMFAQAGRRGRGVGPKPADFCHDDCDDVAQEVVIRGIRHFQRYALKERRWDPARGATMKTYFIGGCIGEFSNVYRRWRAAGDIPTDPQMLAEADDRHAVNPADEVAHAEAICSVLEGLEAGEREIIQLYRTGHSHEEIARALDLSSKDAAAERVRRILRRIKDARKRLDRDDEGA